MSDYQKAVKAFLFSFLGQTTESSSDLDLSEEAHHPPNPHFIFPIGWTSSTDIKDTS
jgi:hypothetical protein